MRKGRTIKRRTNKRIYNQSNKRNRRSRSRNFRIKSRKTRKRCYKGG